MAEERRWNGHETNRACEAAEVPPIRSHRRDPVLLTSVVDLDDEQFHRKGAESADVGGEFVAVDEDPAGVVRRADVEEQSPAPQLIGRHRDLAAIPDRSLVVVKPVVLGVPISRDGERR